MDHKSSVLKSKSSNSAITTKSEKSNKKTRSNADFQPVKLKKRGVYVEQKNNKLNLNSLDNIDPVKQGRQRPTRPPPCPRRGQKEFLASVLTILSKDNSAQYLDYPLDPDYLLTVEKENCVKRRRGLDAETSEKETSVEKKTKYHSRVLNNMLRKDSKKVVILQNRKEITHTPSNYSNKSYKEFSDARYKSLPPPVNYDNCDDNDFNTMKNLVARSKAAAQTLANLKDPITLVSENTQKDEKGLYNFFVDLLETTFNVYNEEKTDFNKVHTPSESGSKVVFEIHENVAKKMAVTENRNNDRNEEETPVAKPTCRNKKRHSVNDHIIPLDIPKSPAISPKLESNRRQYKRKLKTECFFYQNPKFKTISLPQSVIMNKLSSHKRTRKQTFLNMLKEQLRMDDCSFEEPQNMHQALKLIARNKRRNKEIHFTDDVKRTDDDERKQKCMLKRRKLISSSTKSTKKNYSFNKDKKIIDKTFRTDTIAHKFSDPSIFSKNLSKSGYSTEGDKTESYHSLEVHNYDFEANPTKRYSQNKRIPFAKKSSSTYLKEEFSPSTSILKFITSMSSVEHFGSDSLF